MGFLITSEHVLETFDGLGPAHAALEGGVGGVKMLGEFGCFVHAAISCGLILGGWFFRPPRQAQMIVE